MNLDLGYLCYIHIYLLFGSSFFVVDTLQIILALFVPLPCLCTLCDYVVCCAPLHIPFLPHLYDVVPLFAAVIMPIRLIMLAV